MAARERELTPDARTPRLAMAVARGLFKLMAYKDEYEVARLYTGESFQAQLKGQFEGDYSLRFHMAPPIFARKDPRTGVPRKMTLGPRTMTALKALARLKGLRGTWFDPSATAERKMERSLIRGVPPDHRPAARGVEPGQPCASGYNRRPCRNHPRLRPREGGKRREVSDGVEPLDAKLYGACPARYAPAENRINIRSERHRPRRALLGAPSAFSNKLL